MSIEQEATYCQSERCGARLPFPGPRFCLNGGICASQAGAPLKPWEHFCEECGKFFTGPRNKKFCSRACKYVPSRRAVPEIPESRRCPECGATYANFNKYCSPSCARSGCLSPLRKALDARDRDAMFSELVRICEPTDAGCLLWSELDPGTYSSVYREICEVWYGAPLGVQQAHHICAVRACVNPYHIQPVTHAENMAEMLARRAFVARISELEEVVQKLAPNHPALNVVGFRRS